VDKQVVIKLDDYPEDGIYELEIDSFLIGESSLLLIIHHGQYHVIENKCGHFGVPLSNGLIDGNEIICSQHGISFDLDTGKVVNRPYENCDPIKIIPVNKSGNMLYLEL